MAAEPVRFLTKSLLGSRFVHPDHLGTPRVITASTALAATTGTGITSPQTVNKAVWRWDSDPFGSNATANSAPNENPNTLSQVVGTATLPYLFGFDLAFPGQKRDRETGKHYNYFRDYDPAVGRYFESDPIGLRGGLSTFGYVRQHPLRHTDRPGLNSDPPPFDFDEWPPRFPYPIPAIRRECTGLSSVQCAAKLSCGRFAVFRHGVSSGDDGDAMRHCTWSYCMAKIVGSASAQEIGLAQEILHPPGLAGHDDNINDVLMDFCNNRHGRKCASSSSCENCCSQAPLSNSRSDTCRDGPCR